MSQRVKYLTELMPRLERNASVSNADAGTALDNLKMVGYDTKKVKQLGTLLLAQSHAFVDSEDLEFRVSLFFMLALVSLLHTSTLTATRDAVQQELQAPDPRSN